MAGSERLRHTHEAPPKDALEFASRVARLDEQWQQAVRTGSNSGGREAQPDGSLTIRYATPARLTALSAPADWLAASLDLPSNAAGIRWSHPASGPALAGAQPHVLRSLADAQIPGMLEFSSISAAPNRGTIRAPWVAGVALMLVLVLAGAYAMYRGVNRVSWIKLATEGRAGRVCHSSTVKRPAAPSAPTAASPLNRHEKNRLGLSDGAGITPAALASGSVARSSTGTLIR